MTMTQKSVATARRNLAYRIMRYLDALDEEKRRPSLHEGEQLLKALAKLKSTDYPDGEVAMMWAEWATRQPASAGTAFTDPHPGAAPAALRTRFAEITKGEV